MSTLDKTELRGVGGSLRRLKSSLFFQLVAIISAFCPVFAGSAPSQAAGANAHAILAGTAETRDNNSMAERYGYFFRTSHTFSSAIDPGALSISTYGLGGLVAPSVRKDGIIRARLGKVVLGGAPVSTLDFNGDGLIQFQAALSVLRSGLNESSVTNKGAVKPDGGPVLVSARAVEGVVNNAVNLGGLVEAHNVAIKNGAIVLSGGDSGRAGDARSVEALAPAPAALPPGNYVITITADNVVRFYGAANPILDFTMNVLGTGLGGKIIFDKTFTLPSGTNIGFLGFGGRVIVLQTNATASSPPGIYPITLSGNFKHVPPDDVTATFFPIPGTLDILSITNTNVPVRLSYNIQTGFDEISRAVYLFPAATMLQPQILFANDGNLELWSILGQ